MSLSTKVLLFLCFQILVLQKNGLAQLRSEVVNGDTILIFTQPMRDKFEETVFASVSNTDSSFIYNYNIFSSPTSEQDIWFWMIITDSDFLESTSPSGWRFINRATNPKRISWGGQNDSAKIRPSSFKNGFRLNSKNRPKIKNYYMEGWEQIILQNGQKPDSIEKSSFFDVAKEGITIFPMTEVIEDLLNLTDTLETFRFRSCTELDWATDAGVCGELDDDLSEVRANLQAGDSLSAANTLTEFIALVEAEKDVSLTTEGYALLYFNAEYLRRRLAYEEESVE